MLDRTQTVAQTVLDHPECGKVFQKHRIDFCCGGNVTIASLAQKRGVDLAALCADLERVMALRSGPSASLPARWATPVLVEHIVATHHTYLREALAFVVPLAAKVARVHGEHNAKLGELASAVGALSAALLHHLDEEEQTLFPALLAAAPEATQFMPSMDSMLNDHLQVKGMLERIRAAADEFAIPEWACTSYRTLFAELQRIESDLFVHVHLENHILAPRFGARAQVEG